MLHEMPARIIYNYFLALRTLQIAALVCILSVNNSDAAEIHYASSEECELVLSGEIVEGDAKMVAIEFQEMNWLDDQLEVGFFEEGTYGRTLCLNGPGGSYIEARMISELIQTAGVTTVLDGQAACMSACALIFMAGNVRGYEFGDTNRRMHASATLGFHAPYLSLDGDSSYSAEEVTIFMHQFADIYSDIIAFAARRSSFSLYITTPYSLVGEMMAMRSDEMLLVDNIDRIGRWDIRLFGHTPLHRLQDDELLQACQNFIRWSNDHSSSHYLDWRIGPLSGGLPRPRLLNDSASKFDGYYEILDRGYATVGCYIRPNINQGEVVSFAICYIDEYLSRSLGYCPESPYLIPAYFAYDPGSRLSNLVHD